MEKETRSFRIDGLEVREDGEKPKIRGYAAVFNSETVIGDMFREVIAPGAFKRAITEKQDVRALFNHDPNHVLGRTKAGTLSLSEDKKGLRVEVEPPESRFVEDLLESIRRGDIDQMSFGFRVNGEDGQSFERGKDGKLPLRTLKDLDLFDVSAVTYPAYDDTTVAVRCLNEMNQADEEEKARESSRVERERSLKLKSLRVGG